VLEALLRALHPLVPFVTEEIWHHVAPKLGIEGVSISLQAYPEPAAYPFDDAAACADIDWLQAVVSSLRRLRSEMNVAPSKSIALLLDGGTATDRQRVARHADSIGFLARTASQQWLAAGGEPPAASAAVVGELTLLVPLAGLVDLDAERTRLAKEIKRVEGEIGKCRGKLGNDSFVANAPPAVVEQERQRLADFTTELNGLRQQSERLAG